MNSQATTKVLVKSTTKVSLNERFTNMLKNKQPAVVNVRSTMQQQNTASARNRRLAQQMENRPTVQAALQNKPTKSLKQRLGIQARLGRPMGTATRGGVGFQGFARAGAQGVMRGTLRGRGRGTFFRGTMSFRGMARGRGGPMRFAVRRGMRQRGGQMNRIGVLVSRGSHGVIRGRGFQGRGGGFQGRGRGGTFIRRGAFGGRGRGMRGRGQGAGRPALTREQLDNQLDDYMSKTKGHLDAELDAYMAQADDAE